MSMQHFPSRQAIEAAEPIAFAERQPESTITIHAQCDGWPVDIAYRGKLEQLPTALKRISEAGLVPAAQAGQGTVQKHKPPVVTEFTSAGIPLCPIHRKPMSESQHGGWYCREKGGDFTNERGYCRCVDR